jgi:glycerophosphoryl diester phosphodiesterase
MKGYMKNRISCFCLLICFLCPSIIDAQNRAEQIRKIFLDPNSKTVLIAAHRGDWRNAPENSLLAIKYAIEKKVDIVEVDLKRTKDGQFILMHDRTLDRTTTGKGKVSDWTLDSIRTLKLRNGCGIPTIFKVPTLEEVLLTIKDKVMINLDQSFGYFDDVCKIVKKTGTESQVIMKGTASAADAKKVAGKYLDKIIYMPIIEFDKIDGVEQVKEFLNTMHPVAFELVFSKENDTAPLTVKKMLAGKSRIWYNIMWGSLDGGYEDDLALQNSNSQYGYVINTLGAGVLQTDRPVNLLNYLRKTGKHK